MTPNQPQYEGTMNEMMRAQEEGDDALQAAKRQLTDMLDGITERAREYSRYADETVQQNPWTAVGIGFGVGIVMGALLMMAARR